MGKWYKDVNQHTILQLPKDEAGINVWCRLIKRCNNRFKVCGSTRLCEKHFETCFISKPPGGKNRRLLTGAKPVLHSWNDWKTRGFLVGNLQKNVLRLLLLLLKMVTMDESASVSNPEVMEIIEPDDDYNDNNNVNNDYIIWREENEWLKKENERLKQ